MVTPPDEDLSRLLAFPPAPPGPPAPHEFPAVRSLSALGSPHFLRVPPMRFRPTHRQLRNRLAYKATRENSASDHLCQIVPEKRPSRKIGCAPVHSCRNHVVSAH